VVLVCEEVLDSRDHAGVDADDEPDYAGVYAGDGCCDAFAQSFPFTGYGLSLCEVAKAAAFRTGAATTSSAMPAFSGSLFQGGYTGKVVVDVVQRDFDIIVVAIGFAEIAEGRSSGGDS
jgi:hypothetical protein